MISPNPEIILAFQSRFAKVAGPFHEDPDKLAMPRDAFIAQFSNVGPEIERTAWIAGAMPWGRRWEWLQAPLAGHRLAAGRLALPADQTMIRASKARGDDSYGMVTSCALSKRTFACGLICAAAASSEESVRPVVGSKTSDGWAAVSSDRRCTASVASKV
jgi:hypothetical protein